jgi:hypothetical protein
MTFGVVHHFPGGTQESCAASIAAVHPATGLPAGQILHAAGPSADGQTFRDGISTPRMAAGIPGGFPTTETVFDVNTLES